jgi:hypothetical protein
MEPEVVTVLELLPRLDLFGQQVQRMTPQLRQGRAIVSGGETVRSILTNATRG